MNSFSFFSLSFERFVFFFFKYYFPPPHLTLIQTILYVYLVLNSPFNFILFFIILPSLKCNKKKLSFLKYINTSSNVSSNIHSTIFFSSHNEFTQFNYYFFLSSSFKLCILINSVFIVKYHPYSALNPWIIQIILNLVYKSLHKIHFFYIKILFFFL